MISKFVKYEIKGDGIKTTNRLTGINGIELFTLCLSMLEDVEHLMNILNKKAVNKNE